MENVERGPTMLIPMPANNYLSWVLLATLLVSCSSEEQPDRPARLGDSWSGESSEAHDRLKIPSSAPLVIFLGDSLTAGLHLDEDLAFPAVLQRRMSDRGLPFRLVNAGVSGDTTAGGLSRIDWLLNQEPEVVVVELGGNDGLRGKELAQIEQALSQIITRIQSRGAVAVLLGMRIPPSYGQDYSQGFHDLYGRLAEQLDATWVPEVLEGVGGVRSMNLADGLHPNVDGHERMADNIEGPLAEALEALTVR
jgi:acyl-CoA thioesterase I